MNQSNQASVILKRVPSVLFFGLLFIFSFWLMFSTFGYNPQKREIIPSLKLWSDFGAHLPLIRSFSIGPNLNRLLHFQPVQSPLFPGEAIRYHFLFYAFVGLLERLGLRLDWALNLPSTLGFFGILLMIYLLSWELFKKKAVAILSVLFFLFNGSLTFVYFFQKFPPGLATLGQIIHNQDFASFGPWDHNLVSAFWNLNIYTNQRHLAPSFAVGLLLIYLSLRLKADLKLKSKILWGLALGLLFGILVFLNLAAAAATAIFLAWIFLLRPPTRISLISSIIAVFPFFLYWKILTLPSGQIFFNPGYLVAKPLTLVGFVTYWFYNLGLYSILIPLSLVLAPRPVRRLLLIPLVILFVAPNLWQFSPDMINNHKFFNFFLIFGNMLSAYVLIKVFSIGRIGKLVGLVGLVGLVLSGVIDLFPIINDARGNLTDFPANPDVHFFLNHTKPTDVVLNSTFFYHPASLAGRSIYFGYTYFTWSYGYDGPSRERIFLKIYRAPTLSEACNLLTINQINYVELNQNQPDKYLNPNWNLWAGLTPSYDNQSSGVRVFDVAKICPVN